MRASAFTLAATATLALTVSAFPLSAVTSDLMLEARDGLLNPDIDCEFLRRREDDADNNGLVPISPPKGGVNPNCITATNSGSGTATSGNGAMKGSNSGNKKGTSSSTGMETSKGTDKGMDKSNNSATTSEAECEDDDMTNMGAKSGASSRKGMKSSISNKAASDASSAAQPQNLSNENEGQNKAEVDRSRHGRRRYRWGRHGWGWYDPYYYEPHGLLSDLLG